MPTTRKNEFGPYRVLRKLGEGGMGTVYQVEHKETHQLFALKTLHASHIKSAESIRFHREFRILQQLDHPCIVRVKEFFSTDTDNYYVMEYVSGIPLSELIDRPIPDPQARISLMLKIVIQICDPLYYLHQKNIIHRDLKPSNIMLTGDNKESYVKLLDFGLIRKPEDTSLTGTGYVIGSVCYMSPEQAMGKPVDLRSDLYSLGIIMYEWITGNPPFLDENQVVILGMHQHKKPPPINMPNYCMPFRLESVISKLLAKQREDRISSAHHLSVELQKILQEVNGNSLAGHPTAKGKRPLMFSPVYASPNKLFQKIWRTMSEEWSCPVTVIFLHGADGSGKSRFLKELAECSNRHEFRFYLSGFLDSDESMFQGMTRALQHALEQKHRDLTQRRLNETTLPGRNNDGILGKKIQAGYQGLTHEIVTVEAAARVFMDLFIDLSSPLNVCLLLDDVQNAGENSRALILQLIRDFRAREIVSKKGCRMLIILTINKDIFNSQSLSDFESGLKNLARYQCLNLPLLTRESIRMVALSMLTGDLDAELEDFLFKNSEGSPLKLVETIQLMYEKEEIEYLDGRWIIGGEWIAGHHSRDTLMRFQCSRLSSEGKKFADAASVLGPVFSIKTHRMLLDTSKETYLDGFDSVLDTGTIEEVSGSDDVYQFVDLHFRSYIYSNLTSDSKHYLHRRAAEALAGFCVDLDSALAGKIAWHWEQTEKPDIAYRWRWRAFDLAWTTGSHIEALEHLINARKSLMTDMKLSADFNFEAARTYLNIGRIERRTGQYTLARQSLLTALRHSSKINDLKLRSDIIMQLGALAGMKGDYSYAVRMLHHALAYFKSRDMMAESADCYTNLGASASTVADDSSASQFHNHALKIVRKSNDPGRLCRCYLNCAMSELTLGNRKKASGFFQQAIRYANATGNERFIAFTKNGLAGFLMSGGLTSTRAKRIIRITSDSIQSLTRNGDYFVLADMLYKQAAAKKYMGDVSWLSDAQNSFTLAEEIGVTWLKTAIEKILVVEEHSDDQRK